jgi:hypothetical protein
MCRNDQKLLKYNLQVELFDQVISFDEDKLIFEQN